MATDYDAPRVTESDEADTSLEQLTASRKDTQSPAVDVEHADTAESFELPGADLPVKNSPSASSPSCRTNLLAPVAFWFIIAAISLLLSS
jgi:hypothetical protein